MHSFWRSPWLTQLDPIKGRLEKWPRLVEEKGPFVANSSLARLWQAITRPGSWRSFRREGRKMAVERSDGQSENEVERKRAALHRQLAQDSQFLRESEDLHRRIQKGEHSSDSIPASELRRRLRERKLQQVRGRKPR
jgi:hypothetical protein